eukprot:TRINITY_DN25328_c0_g1_i1.p1 TRINITY_DN25328_c0_g1~~TRINITY_DN25328_c0_g1_i1.p1  ORF type:complete len:149 (-),score=15.94 TRINITY_DN25328_c0_g1_i1:36-482(-)
MCIRDRYQRRVHGELNNSFETNVALLSYRTKIEPSLALLMLLNVDSYRHLESLNSKALTQILVFSFVSHVLTLPDIAISVIHNAEFLSNCHQFLVSTTDEKELGKHKLQDEHNRFARKYLYECWLNLSYKDHMDRLCLLYTSPSPRDS